MMLPALSLLLAALALPIPEYPPAAPATDTPGVIGTAQPPLDILYSHNNRAAA